jgi:hypothetical protein
MAIIKNIPSQRLIHGRILNTSEVSIVSESEYSSQGEDCIIIKGVPSSTVILDSKTTDHTVVKALTHLIIKPDTGKIDEQYDEIELGHGACVEFRFCGGNWYILSSDGLKQS